MDNIYENIGSIGLILRGPMDLTKTKDNGDHSFVTIAAKWRTSGTNDDDDGVNMYFFSLLLSLLHIH